MKKILSLMALLVALSVCTVAFAGERPVKFGMNGDEVQAIQRMLTNAGFYDGEIDGVFGNQTLQAVQEFQRSNGLVADGIVGVQTFQYLSRASVSPEPGRRGRALSVIASAYTAQDDGNSSYTYRGNYVRKGLVAVDPSVIPLGTRLYIPGYGYAIADDIGGAIKGNRIDLAFDNRDEALQFGVQRISVYILD